MGYLTEDQFWEPIKDEYIAGLAALTPEDVFPSPNPGTVHLLIKSVLLFIR